jgi:hypothetical protein
MLGREQSAQKGAMEAQVGGQGLGGSVTASDIGKDTFSKMQMDQSVLQYNANVKSWDITNKMNNDMWAQDVRKSQDMAAKKNAIKEGNMKVYTTLLSTAASVATLGAASAATAAASASSVGVGAGTTVGGFASQTMGTFLAAGA